VTQPIYDIDRSRFIWKLAMDLAEVGLSETEMACVIVASKVWQSKHGRDDRALTRLINKVRQTAGTLERTEGVK
jgi:hypothetical protein